MKNIFVAIGFLVLSLSAQAATQQNFQHIDLCALEAEDDSQVLETISQVDIKKIPSIAPSLLGLVNTYLIGQGYFPAPLTFAEIKELFTTGEDKYDDLYIITFKSLATGAVYTQVKSWPGDNPYGLIFDAGEKLVGKMEDGSVTLITPKGEFYCGDFQP